MRPSKELHFWPHRYVAPLNCRSHADQCQLPVRQSEDDEDDRPNYSAAHLQALKNSTPSTPQEFTSAVNSDVEDVSTGTRDLDISSKFGSSLARYDPQQQSSVIPSAGEIAEKKARRARLAKEQQAEEYISLDLDDPGLDDEDLDENVMRDESGRLVLKPKDKYGQGESRLVREDEDIMENFEEFTEDGRISLGRKAEAEAARRRKQEMATQIAEAEGVSDSDSDDSDREQRVAYEHAQTKHGTNTQHATADSAAAARPKTPPIVTPIPTFDAAVEHLRKQISEMQTSRMKKLQDMEALHRETARLAQEEVHIQRALKETADKYEALRREKGISNEDGANTAGVEMPSALVQNGNVNSVDTGGKVDPAGVAMDVDVDSDDEDEQPSGFSGAGLGFGSSMRGRGGLGLGAQAAEEDSDDY